MSREQGRRTRRVERDARYDAPPADVWRAVTDPETAREWFGAVEVDWYPGGSLGFDDGRVGVVEEVVVGERLAWCWQGTGDDPSSVVTIRFEPDDGGTRVRVVEEALVLVVPTVAVGFRAPRRDVGDARALARR